MDEKDKNISAEQPNGTPRNPKEDIPLWLQGLEEQTKANRLRAAQDEGLNISGDEAKQDLTINESSFEDIEVHENQFEGSISAEETTNSDEAYLELNLDPLAQAEAPPNEFSIMEEPTSEPGIGGSQTNSSIEPSSETIEEDNDGDVEKVADISPSDFLPDTVPMPEIPDETDISLKPASDGIGFDELESIPVEESVLDNFEAEELSGSPERSDPISQQTFPEEDEDTEEISVQSPSEPLEESDDLEWVSEVPELGDDFSRFGGEPDPTPNSDENKTFSVDDGFEAESMPAEEISFIDISSAPMEENDSLQSDPAIDFSAFGEEIAFTNEAESPSSEDQSSNNGDSPTEAELTDATRDKIIPDDEGLVFINDEISYYEETQEFSKDELLPENEELPKWLQRLIADSYPDNHIDDARSPVEVTWDEITRPVETPFIEFSEDELDKDAEFVDLEFINDLEKAELEEVKIFEELKFSEVDSSQPVLKDEITIEDTAPIQVTTEDKVYVKEESIIEWTDEDNLYYNPENGYVVEIPEPLQFARQVLIHGDVSQALEILRKYIAEDSFLDEIRMWLTETANSSKNHKSEIWESLGDIASSQNNHQEALSAYSKAINLLLVYKDENGTG